MHVPAHRAIGTRLKEKFSGPAGGALESGLRGSGAGEAAAGPVRPSSECATSCSSFEWIRARFAAIEVEGKENDTADTARAATGGGMELAITGRAFVGMMVGVATPPSGVSICMAS